MARRDRAHDRLKEKCKRPIGIPFVGRFVRGRVVLSEPRLKLIGTDHFASRAR